MMPALVRAPITTGESPGFGVVLVDGKNPISRRLEAHTWWILIKLSKRTSCARRTHKPDASVSEGAS